MVRIKKENYIKLQEKRKTQKLMNIAHQHFMYYVNQHADFIDWLGRFFWEYMCQCMVYERKRELAIDKPFIQYNNDGQILNKYELYKILNFIPNPEDPKECFEYIKQDMHIWVTILILSIYPEFREKEMIPCIKELTGGFVNEHLSRIELFIYQEYIDKLWIKLQENFHEYNIFFVDFKEIDIENNLFDLFRIIEDAQQYNLLLIKNIDYQTYKFLLDFGITKQTPFLCCLGTVEEARKLFDEKGDFYQHKNDISHDYFNNQSTLDFGELLCEKHNNIGFNLYDNLQEWKKEANAPTRDDPEYRKMKKRVRQRDNNTCQCCGYHSDKKTHHKLEVHHIFGYKDHLDYRVEDSNCVVLCQDCHKKYHSLYGRKEVAPDTFMKFIRDYNNFYSKDVQTTLEVHHA